MPASDNRADALLHPIRLRIVQLLAAGARLTPQGIAASLADVPPATLYRHLNRLEAAGILTVVDRRPARGAVEKTYALDLAAAHLGPDALATTTAEDHLRYFNTFMAGLQSNFARYLAQDTFDLAADSVTYRTAPLHLTEAELKDLIAELRQVITTAMSRAPAPDRRLYQLSTILMPAMDIPRPESSS